MNVTRTLASPPLNVLVTLGLTAAIACHAAPTPSPLITDRPLPQPPTPPADIRLEGRVVDERAEPVPEAKVSFGGGAFVPLQPLVTDAAGAFTVSVSGTLRVVTVFVEKVGFETSELRVSWPETAPGNAVQRDLRIYHIRRIQAGESVELAFERDGPYCSPRFDDYGMCRRVRVNSPTAGRLSASVETPPFLAYLDGGLVDAIPVVAGRETIVEVLLFSVTPPTTAVVHTALTER